MSATVVAGETVAGFASGIRHGSKGDGSVIEGASGLIVQEMHFGHHRDRGAVPWWGWLFFAGNLLLRMTLFAFGFIHLDTGEMGGVVGNVHRSAAARFGTGKMFVLQGLDKPTMCCPLLFCFHDASFKSFSLSLFPTPPKGWPEVPFDCEHCPLAVNKTLGIFQLKT